MKLFKLKFNCCIEFWSLRIICKKNLLKKKCNPVDDIKQDNDSLNIISSIIL